VTERRQKEAKSGAGQKAYCRTDGQTGQRHRASLYAITYAAFLRLWAKFLFLDASLSSKKLTCRPADAGR
jgi:hypothetical protein